MMQMEVDFVPMQKGVKMDDLISRQAAVDALEKNKEMINAVLDSLTLDYNARRNLEQRRGQTNEDVETIKELPSAQPEQRWIPVTEGLPKKSGNYLVTWEAVEGCTTTVQMMHFYRYLGGFGDAVKHILAWMPSPEPYRAEMEV